MPKMVIEVPDQFAEVGKAMAEHLAMLQRTVDRLGGGKAVDYAAVEAAIAEGSSRTELAAHRAILKSLDMDVPAVMIGGCATRGWDGVSDRWDPAIEPVFRVRSLAPIRRRAEARRQSRSFGPTKRNVHFESIRYR